MTAAKIQISVGAITFSGEGNEDWLEKQLDKLLKAAPELVVTATPRGGDGESEGANGGEPVGTLPSFLTKKGAGTNQVKRFLATAEWLHLKGKNRLKTGDVTRALSEANQKRLGNPADCLNQNVTKGHCEKEGGEFYVTPEGRVALG